MRSSGRFMLACGAVLLASGGALAQEPDVRDIPPFVMLVVDTSGSMEDLPACECDSPTDCSNCRPKCELPNAASGEPPKDSAGKELKKNRWAVTLEALTGEFRDFQCNPIDRLAENGMTYDAPYSIPYHQPWLCSSGDDVVCPYPTTDLQDQNGILDTYVDTLRFGLMTFDGEYTYKGGSDLLTAGSFQDSLSTGIEGMWSMGGKQAFKYPGCDDEYYVDSGARGPTATEGALVSVDATNCASPPCDQYEINTLIQDMLLRTRPYGGTPIAASLFDLYEHLKNEVNDPYEACRERYAILITDGAPDRDFRDLGCDCANDSPPSCPPFTDPTEFKCPYPLAEEMARKLVVGDGGANPKQIEKLFVLGMSVQDTEARQILDRIAYEGGTTEALAADDPNTLRSTLDGVFSPLLNPISRSVPAFATGLSGAQYQISTGFQVSAPRLSGDAPPWAGIIERRRFICNPTTGELEAPDIEAQDRFHQVITNQTRTRTIYTAVPSVTFTPSELTGQLSKGTNSSTNLCGTSGCRVEELEDSALGPELFGLSTSAEKQTLVEWMYGATGSPRQERKVGDIYHSSPTLVGPPKDEPADDAYTRFRERPEVKERPLVMYVASNDGILRAISVEDFNSSLYPLTVHASDAGLEAGEEIWGFVPPILLPELNDQLTAHRFNLDGTPVVKDVYFKRGPTAEETDYHTILIMGMRGGGNGYFALDVTDPLVPPKFLWQFTDSEMGKTYGQPAIVQATFNWAETEGGVETLQTRAVAILPGGVGQTKDASDPTAPPCPFGNTLSMRKADGTVYQSWLNETPQKENHRNAVQCWHKTGRALYFVDVETGRLIKKLFDTNASIDDGILFPSPVVGSPTAYQDAVGTIADRGFVLDADGILWRIDMRSTDVQDDDPKAGWTVRPFHDLFFDKSAADGGATTYERPILSLDEQRRLVVILGTGDTDDFENPNADNRIVSLTEVTTQAEPTDPEHYEALINWELRNEGLNGNGLFPTELVTGSMALFEGQLFAASFISNTGTNDACEYGRGRMWSLHYVENNGVLNKWPDGSDTTTYGPLRIDVPVQSGVDSDADLFNVGMDDAEPNLLIQGIGTTQRRSCQPPEDPISSYFAPHLAHLEETPEPTIWVVAQASRGAQRGGGSLGGVQAPVARRITYTQVGSWASSVD